MTTFTSIPDGSVTSPQRFVAGAAAAGLKAGDLPDVAMLISETPCSGAGVFTQNRVRAAPVLYDQALLLERPGRLRGVAMNSRYANACTGQAGADAAAKMAEIAENAAQIPARSVFVISTGIIGMQLPMAKIEYGLQRAAECLSSAGGIDAARAIMTTDKRPKHLAVTVDTKAGPVTIGGIAKGAGMIHPNMATLLGVLTTDAVIDAAHLDALLRKTADRTFNAITVDGDTSTNDTVLMLANGASEISITRDPEGWKRFEEAVEHVARELALMVVRDGEGATRFVEIIVEGANTEAVARSVGRAVAKSALVKTALAGGDPNWGRILAATGASGVPVHPDRLRLSARVADASEDDWLLLAEAGATADAEEAVAQRIFAAPEIVLRLELGMGGAAASVWTCDLSTEYVRINADYRS